jgi:hypothetical protein
MRKTGFCVVACLLDERDDAKDLREGRKAVASCVEMGEDLLMVGGG